MSEDRHRASKQDSSDPPESVDPGQQALDEYRAWRQRIYGNSQTPRVKRLGDLLALMREEPPV